MTKIIEWLIIKKIGLRISKNKFIGSDNISYSFGVIQIFTKLKSSLSDEINTLFVSIYTLPDFKNNSLEDHTDAKDIKNYYY